MYKKHLLFLTWLQAAWFLNCLSNNNYYVNIHGGQVIVNSFIDFHPI